jgi:ubiquinone/menaquinone biosynthesis C-methylase UbiE
MDAIWENLFRSQEWGKYPPESVVRFVARNFYSAPKRGEIRLLDAGCGPGACTWFMAREGFQVSGIDGSPTAIRYAGERLNAEDLSADLRVGDYTSLPWADEVFDGAIDTVSFYANLLADWQRAVDEVYRVIKPGGVFFTSSFSNNTWGCGIGQQVEPGSFRDIPEGPFHNRGLAHFVDESELRHLLRRFSRVNVERECRTLMNQSKLVELWIATAVK